MMNRSFEQEFFGEEPLTLRNVVVGVATWEVLYQLSKALFSWSIHTYKSMIWEKGNKVKFLEAGPSYFIGAIHATLVAFRSTYLVVRLVNASLEQQTLCIGGYENEAFFAEATSVIVISYFLYDIVHCLAMYPKLGGIDILVHHFGNILFCCLAGEAKVLYYTACWMAMGEWSTPFLSARFLLIQTGRGNTKMMKYTELAFAITFLMFRPVSFTLGFINLTANIGQVVELAVRTPSRRVSVYTFCFMMVMIYLSWFLQLFWAYKIVGMVVKSSKRNKKKEKCVSVQGERGADVHTRRKMT